MARWPQLDREQPEADPVVLHHGGLPACLDLLLSPPEYQVAVVQTVRLTDDCRVLG